MSPFPSPELIAITRQFGATLTRYADDIAVSGKGDFADNLPSTIVEVLARHGWTVAPEKSHLQMAPAPRSVYGILIHGERLRLGKRHRNQVRMMIRAVENTELDHATRRKFCGHLAYAKSIYGGDLSRL